MVRRIIQACLSLIAGGIVLFLFHSLLEAGLLLAALFGLAAAVGGFLLLSPKKIDPEYLKLAEIYGITPETVRKTIRKGETKVRTMRKIAETIENPKVREDIERICVLSEKIFRNFKTDPKDIRVARPLLNYYLDSTIKILRQYSKLAKKDSGSGHPDAVRRAEEVLGTIEQSFENQLKRLHEDDVLDLDTEIAVLKKAMKMDGAG